MPQITKIRIVNFQYNDGKRLIADELYNFEGEDKRPFDVLINLANGGGKSVLVQLIMQPIIPRARVAGRRIESFFTRPTDHCYVAIEWALDSSKARLMTGIAMAASDSSSDADSDRGFRIKYYTFISSYQDYHGLYNIVNLPLSEKENGRFLPAAFDYVRNLAKKSGGGLERYSSEEGKNWGERLSQYGIIQNEWKMIEELNSNEDGLSKYFSELKSSDAVINKLIIPRIEEKHSHSDHKDDTSLKTMLLSFAKGYSRQQDDFKEREVLSSFHYELKQTKDKAGELWKSNDALENCVKELFGFAEALNAETMRQEGQSQSLKAQQEKLQNTIRHINWEKASADYYAAKKVYERETQELKTAEDDKAEAGRRCYKAQKRLELLECAHYFDQLRGIKSRLAGVNEAIKSCEDNSQSAYRLASLKFSALVAIKRELDELNIELAKKAENRDALAGEVERLKGEISCLNEDIDAAKKDKTTAETTLKIRMEDNEKRVAELKIPASRNFYGKYQGLELESWHIETEKQAQSIAADIEKTRAELERLEQRRDALPKEIAEADIKNRDFQAELKKREDELNTYRAAKTAAQAVFKKHNLDLSRLFTDYGANYLAEQSAKTGAEIKAADREIEATNAAIAAVERGTLHIPKLLSDYLDSTGIGYISVEKYILAQQEKGNLSKEQVLEFLNRYPYAAYGVIVDKADSETICEEAGNKWLPAILPIFTHDDFERMLKGETAAIRSLSLYAKDYFKDSAGYAENLSRVLSEQTSHKERLEQREKEYEADRMALEAICAYNEKFEPGALLEIERINKSIEETGERLKELEAEQNKVKAKAYDAKENEKRLSEEQALIHSRLAAFEELLQKLAEEDRLSQELDAAVKRLRDLTNNHAQKSAEMAQKEVELGKVETDYKALSDKEKTLHNGLERVADAKEAELIEGQWDELLAEYNELLSAQSADLKRLNEDKERLLKDIDEKQKEIDKRHCSLEEYKTLIYSEEAEAKANSERKNAEILKTEAEDAYNSATRSQAKAESAYKTAEGRLSEFGSEPLPVDKIGADFDSRIADANAKIKGIEGQITALNKELSRLQKVQWKAENAAEQRQRPANYPAVTLNEDYEAQLKEITARIKEWEESLKANRQAVGSCLDKMALEYGSKSTDANRAITGMQVIFSDNTVRGDKYYTLYEHIDASMQTVEKRISQIETDLKEVNKTRDDLVRQCLIQGKQMHEGLRTLSDNSRVKVQDKRRRMIEFDIPDTVDENIARVAIEQEIDKGTKEIAAKMSDEGRESEIERIAAKTVGSELLLRKYIGSERISLKAYKIDKNPGNSGYRTWEQTQVNNSGAEKFVVYFAVILALMAYARDGYDGGDWENNRSVLVLDNPFGPISSKHVLQPMFEISKNYNVQMICLSDLSKSDIVSCFDLVVRAVVKPLPLSTKEQLTHEGDEQIEHGFYRSEQMKLL